MLDGAGERERALPHVLLVALVANRPTLHQVHSCVDVSALPRGVVQGVTVLTRASRPAPRAPDLMIGPADVWRPDEYVLDIERVCPRLSVSCDWELLKD